MATEKKYGIKPYRYADGVRYRPNLFTIAEWDEGYNCPGSRNCGGLIKMGNKFFAFAARVGAAHLVQEKRIARIIDEADAYAWGSTQREALLKIKPHLA